MAGEETTTPQNPFAELGFEDPAKALEAFKSMKLDLAKHKTRASEVSTMQQELEALRQAKQQREDAEKTELQKLNDQIARIQADAEKAQAKAAKAERTAMLERGLADNLSSVPEKLRPFASKYLRTTLPGKEWADPETLKSTITESLGEFDSLLPDDMKIVPAGGAEQHRQTQMQPSAGGPVTGFDFNAALHGGKS